MPLGGAQRLLGRCNQEGRRLVSRFKRIGAFAGEVDPETQARLDYERSQYIAVYLRLRHGVQRLAARLRDRVGWGGGR